MTYVYVSGRWVPLPVVERLAPWRPLVRGPDGRWSAAPWRGCFG